MGERDTGLRAFVVDAIASQIAPMKSGIVSPHLTVEIRGHFCDVGLTAERAALDAHRELKAQGAKWVKVLKASRDHETEIASESLLAEMLEAMSGV